ncbi:MAG: transporter substrate-binding domain-containing protein, partial [Rubrobacteraceae bacterium]
MKSTKNSFRVALIIAVLAFTVAFATSCGSGGGGGQGGGEGGGGEDISVASDIAYPPFEFEKDGEPTGFDIDLMNEVGKRAGFTPEYQNVTFDGIIGGLANNQYDAAISSMTITPERAQRIDFSDPYFNADQSLLAPGDAGIG